MSLICNLGNNNQASEGKTFQKGDDARNPGFMAQRKTLSDDVINPESMFDLPCAYCFVL